MIDVYKKKLFIVAVLTLHVVPQLYGLFRVLLFVISWLVIVDHLCLSSNNFWPPYDFTRQLLLLLGLLLGLLFRTGTLAAAAAGTSTPRRMRPVTLESLVPP